MRSFGYSPRRHNKRRVTA
ncbi:hypothetical protein Goklo_008811 [Gossypium klotzschianum]|uniref:Uncharacterized protein n=1 Tax=Gossypium klotzschianum TaxID=34286 RepID=A0A7J8V1X7_9ROSI|nr:hypothetical protein [Gossypium klotzschianum]